MERVLGSRVAQAVQRGGAFSFFLSPQLSSWRPHSLPHEGCRKFPLVSVQDRSQEDVWSEWLVEDLDFLPQRLLFENGSEADVENETKVAPIFSPTTFPVTEARAGPHPRVPCLPSITPTPALILAGLPFTLTPRQPLSPQKPGCKSASLPISLFCQNPCGCQLFPGWNSRPLMRPASPVQPSPSLAPQHSVMVRGLSVS